MITEAADRSTWLRLLGMSSSLTSICRNADGMLDRGRQPALQARQERRAGVETAAARRVWSGDGIASGPASPV